MIEFKLANPEEAREYVEDSTANLKFLVYEQDDCLEVYVGSIDHIPNLKQRDIALQHNLDQNKILGGGMMSYLVDMFMFHDMSIDFGPVPNKAAEQIAKVIADSIKPQYSVEKARIDMYYDALMSKDRIGQKIKRWNQLGYDFDNDKREITLS